MTEPSARVILHSKHEYHGADLFTLEINLHRFVLAEFNTHRCLSRNSASSRAIPFEKQLKYVREDPAIPIVFPAEKPGMSGGEEILRVGQAALEWEYARTKAMDSARRMHELGVHKSVCNRLLEPFLWQTVIATATREAWESVFLLRCSPLAQPEIRVAMEAARDAIRNSVATPLYSGWHLPLVSGIDLEKITTDHGFVDFSPSEILNVLKSVSAARCARVSYLTHDGKRDPKEDMKLAMKLMKPGEGSPPHASPFEHVAYVRDSFFAPRGNFAPYWRQFRHELWR